MNVSVTVRVPAPVRTTVVGASALALVVGGAWVAWGGTDYRVDGPAPASITVDGIELALAQQQPVAAVTVAPGDGTRLLVTATPDAADPCSVVTVRVVDQDADDVRLAAYAYRAVDAPDSCGVTTSGETVVDLGAPLGGRSVMDAGTDRILLGA